MLIKGTLAKKIVQRTGIGKRPLAIRDRIRHANVDEATRHKLLTQYNRLLQGKPVIKHDLKQFLHTLGDKKIVDMPGGTYIYTTFGHNPDKVIRDAQRKERVERHEHMMEQQKEQNKENKESAPSSTGGQHPDSAQLSDSSPMPPREVR